MMAVRIPVERSNTVVGTINTLCAQLADIGVTDYTVSVHTDPVGMCTVRLVFEDPAQYVIARLSLNTVQ